MASASCISIMANVWRGGNTVSMSTAKAACNGCRICSQLNGWKLICLYPWRSGSGSSMKLAGWKLAKAGQYRPRPGVRLECGLSYNNNLNGSVKQRRSCRGSALLPAAAKAMAALKMHQRLWRHLAIMAALWRRLASGVAWRRRRSQSAAAGGGEMSAEEKKQSAIGAIGNLISWRDVESMKYDLVFLADNLCQYVWLKENDSICVWLLLYSWKVVIYCISVASSDSTSVPVILLWKVKKRQYSIL